MDADERTALLAEIHHLAPELGDLPRTATPELRKILAEMQASEARREAAGVERMDGAA